MDKHVSSTVSGITTSKLCSLNSNVTIQSGYRMLSWVTYTFRSGSYRYINCKKSGRGSHGIRGIIWGKAKANISRSRVREQ